MAVIGGEVVDTKGEQRLQGQEGQETDQVWSPAVTFCTDTQYNSLRQVLVSHDRHSPGVWGKRTKCQSYWTSRTTHAHTNTHTHLHKVPGTHPLHGQPSCSGGAPPPPPPPLPPSAGTSFGRGRSESQWKAAYEAEHDVMFVKSIGDKTTDGCTTSYYQCNRSGVFLPKGSGQRRL